MAHKNAGAAEQFPIATYAQREKIFTGIARLATLRGTDLGVPSGMRSAWANPFRANDVPEFIVQRLPASDLLVAYSAHFTTIPKPVDDEGNPEPASNSILLRRTETDFTKTTRWEVRYALGDERHEYDATRTVTGVEQPLTTAFVDVGTLLDSLEDLEQREAATRPTAQLSGPWPEGLVAPEADQLISMLGRSIREAAG